nr:MAG TPA: hypothetical protein [Caudoviricetes sp.]
MGFLYETREIKTVDDLNNVITNENMNSIEVTVNFGVFI